MSNQHFLPQFYMRGFTLPNKKDWVNVIIKRDDLLIIKERKIKNIGFKKNIYRLNHADENTDYDDEITKITEPYFTNNHTWNKIRNNLFNEFNINDSQIILIFLKHIFGRSEYFNQQIYYEALEGTWEGAKFLVTSERILSDFRKAMITNLNTKLEKSHSLVLFKSIYPLCTVSNAIGSSPLKLIYKNKLITNTYGMSLSSKLYAYVNYDKNIPKTRFLMKEMKKEEAETINNRLLSRLICDNEINFFIMPDGYKLNEEMLLYGWDLFAKNDNEIIYKKSKNYSQRIKEFLDRYHSQ